MKIAVIIPAAGAGRRYRDEGIAAETLRSKLDEDLGGRPVLQRTVELFTKHPGVAAIIVAGPADADAMSGFRQRHGDKLGLLGATLCPGGPTHRYETVAGALKLVPGDCTHVLVHDAARPCASPELIERIIDAAAHHPAVVPALEVPDTLKLVAESEIERPRDPLASILGVGAGGERWRRVERTLSRERVVAVQTPQIFRADVLKRAYAQPDLASTDDAQLVERLGEEVIVVAGEPTNIKLTRPADIRLARAILGVRPPDQRPTHMRF